VLRDVAKPGQPSDIFPVHAISFHPRNIFVTGGGDGTMVTWDKAARSKIASFDLLHKKMPIVDVKFDKTVSLLVSLY
jgi:WD40 repeat protein